jgi:hypothetical protein
LSRIRKRLAKSDSASDDISVTAVSFMAAIAVRHPFIPKACLATKANVAHRKQLEMGSLIKSTSRRSSAWSKHVADLTSSAMGAWTNAFYCSKTSE